jgi:hypothetical protein
LEHLEVIETPEAEEEQLYRLCKNGTNLRYADFDKELADQVASESTTVV